MAFIDRHDLLHAAHAELFPLRLGDVVSRHLRISPAEHRHHLALSAVGVGRDLGARLANAVAALLRFVEPARIAYFLNFAAHAFFFIGSTRPFTILPVKTSAPRIPAARAARKLSENCGCTGTVTVVLPRLFSVAICTAILRTIWRRWGRPKRCASPTRKNV